MRSHLRDRRQGNAMPRHEVLFPPHPCPTPPTAVRNPPHIGLPACLPVPRKTPRVVRCRGAEWVCDVAT